MLHIPGLAFDGNVGYSPIALEKNAIVLGIAAEKYGSRFFQNGARPSGILTHPNTVKAPKRLRESWNAAYGGSGNSGKVAILEESINYDGVYMKDEVTGEGIEGHPLTSMQAIDICETFIKGLTDEPFDLFAVGEAPGVIQDDERIMAGTERTGTGYSYALAFTRKVEGVSLLPSLGSSMSTDSWRDDLYTTPVGYEEIVMAVNLEGQVTNFYWSNPYDIGQRTDEQTLVSFDQILAIAKQVLPLKYQWEEASGGEITLDIKRVQLGYMALLQRDKLSFALTPVWNFYGNLNNSAESRSDVVTLLTVNATDGTVVDLDYGY